MADQDSPVTNVVLLGRAGNGKSSTGNTILGKNMFNVKIMGEGPNTRCEMYKAGTLGGSITNVIDTPGLFDFAVSKDYISKEIIKCLTMVEEGIHAVLFVLSVRSRISQEEESALNTLLHIFDNNILDFFIVVFTGGDALEEDNQTLDDYLGEGCPEFLKRVLSLCGGRKVLFNNITKDESKKTKQLNQLLAHVTAIGKKNGGIPYTYKMHREIKGKIDKLGEQERDIDAKNLAEADLAVMKEKLRMEHQTIMNMMTQTVNSLKQSAEAHEREMRQLKDTLQLKDTETMSMIAHMVENALKQSGAAHMNMMEKMMDNALKQSATAHEREMRELKETLQRKQHLLSSPRKSKTCECNIM